MQLQGAAEFAVVRMPPPPMKGVALFALDPVGVDVPPSKKLDVLIGKILADDADDSHRSEKTRRQSEVGRRSTQDPLRRAERRLDRMQTTSPHNQDAHLFNPKLS